MTDCSWHMCISTTWKRLKNNGGQELVAYYQTRVIEGGVQKGVQKLPLVETCQESVTRCWDSELMGQVPVGRGRRVQPRVDSVVDDSI